MTKHRNKLNKEQVEVLELLYKFRFGTNELFAYYFGKKDRSYIFKRLSILVEQGLISKRFEASYRLAGKPAAYYLTVTGAKQLQEARQLSFDTKYLYRAKTAKNDYIKRCLDIFDLYIHLRSKYGVGAKFFTKVDLTHEDFDYFPQPTPDAYIRILNHGDETQYFIEYLYENQPYFIINKLAQKYIKYDEDGDWEQTESKLPKVIVICESKELQKGSVFEGDVSIAVVVNDKAKTSYVLEN
jgi:hypothetical protein